MQFGANLRRTGAREMVEIEKGSEDQEGEVTTETLNRVYEQPALRQATGETIRPGGLALTDKALALCTLPPGARVLDVGCGSGATVEHLRAHHSLIAFGLDLSAMLLQSGHRQNPTLPLVQASGERVPFASGQLDAIIAECSLSVMANANQVLKEFKRALKADGLLILSDVYARNPDGLSALQHLPPDTCLSGAISQVQLSERLQAHGFQITLWQDHSAALRQLAVQLIMAHGSMQQFWQQTASAGAASEIERATAKIKPGYYLLLARKGAASR